MPDKLKRPPPAVVVAGDPVRGYALTGPFPGGRREAFVWLGGRRDEVVTLKPPLTERAPPAAGGKAYAVVVGLFAEGFRVFGPYADTAAAWADLRLRRQHHERLCGHVLPLEPP